MKKHLKLSLYIRLNEVDGALDYSMPPGAVVTEEDGLTVYTYEHDVSKRTTIRVRVNRNEGLQSHLIVKKICLGGIELQNLPHWSVYSRDDGCADHTYGYMGIPGTYIFNIHQNPLTHNFLSYFLNISSNVTQK